MSSMVSAAVSAAIFLVYTIGSSKETRVVRRKKWILVFRKVICMINLISIFYVFRSLYLYFWLGNDGYMVWYMFFEF